MILIIAEKPSAAKRIALALSDDKPRIEKKKGIPVYKLTIKGEEAIVISAAGHLYGLGEKNKSFDYPVFDIEWKPLYEIDKNAKHVKKFLQVIKSFIDKADKVIVACDYDIEGELIGKNIVTLALKKKDAERMKFSTLTPTELRKSFEERMKTLDWGQANAGEARHILDWIYGINLSRALMHSSKKSGQYNILSIGRVQGPALRIVVEKEKEIESFKPEKYYEIKAKLFKDKEFIAIYEEGRIKSKEKAQEILREIEKEKNARVIAIKQTEKKIKPLPAFDLTTLQTEAYRLYRYSPSKTLSIAQQLYLNGYISYPRTSSQKLPPGIGYKKILTQLSKRFSIAKELIGRKPVQGKKDDPAHPAIYPTGILPEKLKKEEEKIYELIVKRFLSAFSEEAVRRTQEVRIDIKGKIFIAKGTTTIKEGWLRIYPTSMKNEELPLLNEGEQIKVKKILLEEKETQPPKRYTQAGLVKELEKRNLGTKATRAAIVKTLYDRGYIQDDPIKPTLLGRKIVDILEKYSKQIVDEELTRHFEEEMEQIRRKKKNVDEVVEEAKKVLEKIIKEFKEKESFIGKELVEAYRDQEKKDRIIGKCPKCGGDLVIKYSRKNKQRFIACSNYPKCDFTASIPQKGRITRTEKKCKYCGYPIIKINKKEYCINPNCPGKATENDVKEKTIKSEGKIYLNRKCPKCGGRLLIRKGPYGSFIACENYPKCKYSERIKKS